MVLHAPSSGSTLMHVLLYAPSHPSAMRPQTSTVGSPEGSTKIPSLEILNILKIFLIIRNSLDIVQSTYRVNDIKLSASLYRAELYARLE